MHIRANITDTIDISLPDGCVVSASGEAWLKWLICGQELLAACELGLAHIESEVKTSEERESDGDRIRSIIQKCQGVSETNRTSDRCTLP
jgi:hypothetical protein